MKTKDIVIGQKYFHPAHPEAAYIGICIKSGKAGFNFRKTLLLMGNHSTVISPNKYNRKWWKKFVKVSWHWLKTRYSTHMKINVTLEEVKTLIAAKHNLGVDDSIHIELPITPVEPASKYIAALVSASKQFDLMQNKIAAIKFVRGEVTGLGLGDAKYAIENLDACILRCAKTGEIPSWN